MKVKITLTVGNCAACPYMFTDFEEGTRYFCRHKNRNARYGNSITVKHRNQWDTVLKSVDKVEKFCPLIKRRK